MMCIYQCNASTISEFIKIALALGVNLDYRKSIETQIIEKNEVLFERKEVVAEFVDYVTTFVN